MEIDKIKPIIEAILYSSGRVVEIKELMAILELSYEDIDEILQNMKTDFESSNRGLEVIRVDERLSAMYKKGIL